MGTVDVYRVTDKLDDLTLDVVVTRLEARGKHPRFIAMMGEYLDAMDIDSAKAVLDIGCGTGVAARAIAQRKGFAGHITGIDVSPYLVAAAKRLAEDEGAGGVIGFVPEIRIAFSSRHLRSTPRWHTPWSVTLATRSPC